MVEEGMDHHRGHHRHHNCCSGRRARRGHQKECIPQLYNTQLHSVRDLFTGRLVSECSNVFKQSRLRVDIVSLTRKYTADYRWNSFDKFDYFSDTDPTNGFVTYVSQEIAETLNLTYASTSSAVLRVDTSDADTSDSSDSSGSSDSSDSSGTNSGQSTSSGQSSQGGQNNQGGQGAPGQRRRATATSRNSVRVTSKNQYNKGLFIFDVIHTPYGCGTWPALWFSDVANWPSYGEIDVMEAVNNATSGNQVTLHTKSGCKMDHKRKQTGTTTHDNCYWAANNEAGCGVQGNASTFGEDFNTLGGGVTAVEWRAAGIRVWQFERDSIPDDISNNSPNPSSWGRALADFPDTGCDIGSHFKNQSIIINIDLCGDWAGSTSVYSSQFSCKWKTILLYGVTMHATDVLTGTDES